MKELYQYTDVSHYHDPGLLVRGSRRQREVYIKAQPTPTPLASLGAAEMEEKKSYLNISFLFKWKRRNHVLTHGSTGVRLDKNEDDKNEDLVFSEGS